VNNFIGVCKTVEVMPDCDFLFYYYYYYYYYYYPFSLIVHMHIIIITETCVIKNINKLKLRFLGWIEVQLHLLLRE